MKACPYCKTPVDDHNTVKCIVETDEHDYYYSAWVQCFQCMMRGPMVDDQEDVDIYSAKDAVAEAWKKWNRLKR